MLTQAGRLWRENHKEKLREYNHKYYLEHQAKRLEYNKKYRQTHKEQIRNKNRVWFEKNKQNYYDWYKKYKNKKEVKKKSYLKYRERNLEYNKRWRKEHPNFAHEWYVKNKKKIRDYYREYYKQKPELYLEWSRRKLKQLNKFYRGNIPISYALQAWSKTVKKRDNNQCQVCGKPAEHSHHIFPKMKYPQLCFNINNGISLCKLHHNETHGYNLEKMVIK